MKKLYISPSKENLVTLEISNLLKEYLKRDDIDVYIADEDLTNRSYEAEELMSDIYLCIRVFENKNSNNIPIIICKNIDESRLLSNLIFDQIKLIYNKNIQFEDVLESKKILSKDKILIPFCFIGFDCDEKQSEWLNLNKEKIAKAIAVGIKEYFR
mgnify:FL=1